MLRVVAIAGFVAIAMAIISAAYFGLERYCSLQHQGNNENSQSTSTGKEHASPEGQQTKPTATFNLIVTEPGKIDGSYYAQNTKEEKESWSRRFWCDAKIGDASVTGINSCIAVVRNDRPPAALELRAHTEITEPITFKSGEHGFAITPDTVSFTELVRSGLPGEDTVFCVGVVVYRDKNDVERLTGFCRRYDGRSERWLQQADQDYEYAY